MTTSSANGSVGDTFVLKFAILSIEKQFSPKKFLGNEKLKAELRELTSKA